MDDFDEKYKETKKNRMKKIYHFTNIDLFDSKLHRKNFIILFYQPVKFEYELICRFSKSYVEPRIFHQNDRKKKY